MQTGATGYQGAKPETFQSALTKPSLEECLALLQSLLQPNPCSLHRMCDFTFPSAIQALRISSDILEVYHIPPQRQYCLAERAVCKAVSNLVTRCHQSLPLSMAFQIPLFLLNRPGIVVTSNKACIHAYSSRLCKENEHPESSSASVATMLPSGSNPHQIIHTGNRKSEPNGSKILAK